MKKIILLTLITILLLNIGEVQSAFCCKEEETSQKKCYSEGQCCDGIWYPACFWFDIWVEPRSMMFTVGKRTTVNLYIRNLCPYPDNYNLSYNITAPNSELIKVDLTGFEYVKDVGSEEIRVVYPRIIILEASASGDIIFNVTSEGNSTIQKNATLTVLPSDSPQSLPEFGFSGMVVMIILAVVVSSIFKKI